MKAGSIVECIDNSKFEQHVKKNTPYTVREVLPTGSVLKSISEFRLIIGEACIRLEEVSPSVTAYNTQWPDMPFPMIRFRELVYDTNEIEEIFSRELELVKV